REVVAQMDAVRVERAVGGAEAVRGAQREGERVADLQRDVALHGALPEQVRERATDELGDDDRRLAVEVRLDQVDEARPFGERPQLEALLEPAAALERQLLEPAHDNRRTIAVAPEIGGAVFARSQHLTELETRARQRLHGRGDRHGCARLYVSRGGL